MKQFYICLIMSQSGRFLSQFDTAVTDWPATTCSTHTMYTVLTHTRMYTVLSCLCENNHLSICLLGWITLINHIHVVRHVRFCSFQLDLAAAQFGSRFNSCKTYHQYEYGILCITKYQTTFSVNLQNYII